MSASSLFSELKRRNVFRAGAFYAAAGWLLVQIATQVFPFFEVPNWAVRLVVVAVIVGLPFALAFAWFYELTPEGLKRESEIERSKSIRRATGRRIDRWIIAVLGLAVVLLLANTFVLHRDTGSTATDKSIAVLPFENLSEDKANGYFTDGIQDEILARLAKIGALRVISRTSTQQYAARPENLPEIGRQLGVANILEGSVQKAGGTVRITVQLIRAATDEHIWAESYDRRLDDVFGVESEVAQTIANALEVRLSGHERALLEARPTDHPDAYDAYLRGLALETRSLESSHDAPTQAAQLYAEAVRLDPRFALAWARLAIVKSFMYSNSIDRTPTLPAEVKQAADTALHLQPDLGEAHLAIGYYRYRCLRDFDGGLRDFEQARQRLPNNAHVLAAIAYIERRQGRWQDSIAHLEQATLLDPREVVMFLELASNHAALRQYAKARATLDHALEVQPDATSLVTAKAWAWLAEGNLEQAGTLLDSVPLRADDTETFMVRMSWLWYRRNFTAMVAALAQALAQSGGALGSWRVQYQLWLGMGQLRAGDEAAARTSLAKTIELAQQYRKAAPDDAKLVESLALAHANLGDKAAALREAQQAIDLAAGDALLQPGLEQTRAEIQAGLGDTDAAIGALPHLLAMPNGTTIADLRLNPLWDPLRKDARFQKLITTDPAPPDTPR
ncbi:MAG: hypothetical protein GXC76_00300 [Rhodanobacteraceae bacterium]|jgi:TolB-like protein/Flp pilus assembly protein TadD|nr:hypothetical protein [Rhodanobacteraceae bacterium]